MATKPLDPPSAASRSAFFLSVVALLWRTPSPSCRLPPIFDMPEGGGSALPWAWCGRWNRPRTVVGDCGDSCLVWGIDRAALAVVMTRNQSLFLRGRVFAGSKWETDFCEQRLIPPSQSQVATLGEKLDTISSQYFYRSTPVQNLMYV